MIQSVNKWGGWRLYTSDFISTVVLQGALPSVAVVKLRLTPTTTVTGACNQCLWSHIRAQTGESTGQLGKSMKVHTTQTGLKSIWTHKHTHEVFYSYMYCIYFMSMTETITIANRWYVKQQPARKHIRLTVCIIAEYQTWNLNTSIQMDCTIYVLNFKHSYIHRLAQALLCVYQHLHGKAHA